eukprot:TRINITY_DN1466_c0_g1_i1.p1 TRINITY_DN1466_c0_g1~~TRINITY_DN1466_c0_g1_i1.p1  ORF type:complete len:192 (+),score=28.79 TRINITY_DN1466_c0_g1_i1:400-975(+)
MQGTTYGAFGTCQMHQFYQKIAEIRYKKHGDFDSFIMYFSGHGHEGKIIGHTTDPSRAGEEGTGVQISQITDSFQPKNCPSLRGKPKIFLWDCCRGERAPTNLSSKSWLTMNSKFVAPDFQDFLYGYASALSFIAHVGDKYSTDSMSVWTYFLLKRLEDNCGTQHMCDVLVGVQRDVSDYAKQRKSKQTNF